MYQQHLSASGYAKLLNVRTSYIREYMFYEGFLDHEYKITPKGSEAGLIYKSFKTDEGETIEYVAFPVGLIKENGF